MSHTVISSEVYDAPPAGNDYLIQIKVKNGPLARAMRMRGFKTARALADASGTGQAIYYYLTLSRAPIGSRGWKQSALLIAKTLRLPPDSLFPEQHLEQVLAHNSGEFEISAADLRLMLAPEPPQTPEEHMLETQMRANVGKAVATLPPRLQQILAARFGLDGEEPKTIAELAETHHVSSARISQMEWKALRLLRAPGPMRMLKAAAPDHYSVPISALARYRKEYPTAPPPEPIAPLPTRPQSLPPDPPSASPPIEWWNTPLDSGNAIDMGLYLYMRADDLHLLTPHQWRFLHKIKTRNGIVMFARKSIVK